MGCCYIVIGSFTVLFAIVLLLLLVYKRCSYPYPLEKTTYTMAPTLGGGGLGEYTEPSSTIGSGYWTEMWLITEYHELGSLYDYLCQNTLNNWDMLVFAFSIVNGLTFLHSEIRGTSGALQNSTNYCYSAGRCLGLANRNGNATTIILVDMLWGYDIYG
eukprot:sb/3472993/